MQDDHVPHLNLDMPGGIRPAYNYADVLMVCVTVSAIAHLSQKFLAGLTMVFSKFFDAEFRSHMMEVLSRSLVMKSEAATRLLYLLEDPSRHREMRTNYMV